MFQTLLSSFVLFASFAGGESAAVAFSPRVPVMLWSTPTPQLVQDLRRARQEFGLRRFVLSAPCDLRGAGKADIGCYERIGKEIAVVKQGLSDLEDVEIGWWCAPTFQAAASEPGQRIMDCDGNVSGAICPLDRGHAADFARKLCAGLKIGRPGVVLIEDDVTLSNHPGLKNAMKGCFCPLHMKAFAEKVGKTWTPKEVAGLFRNRTKENAPLRQAWADVSRESLVWFAATVRREIDKVAPETRVCQCQSGYVDFDGDTTEAVARAWAGKTRPISRIFGSCYYDENLPCSVANGLSHVFWSAQHLPADFEIIHETDSYPHIRFYNSSLFLIGELAGALKAGAQDSLYYCMRYNDDPLEDPGYAARLRDFRARFETVTRFRAEARPVGVRMVYTPREVYMVRGETKKSASCGMLAASTHFLAKLGFPAVTREDAPVATLFGNTPEALTDEEIRALFAGGLFIDGEAAAILSQRGFSDLMGVEARDDADHRVGFAYERILDVAGCAARGRNVRYSCSNGQATLGWTRYECVFAELKALPGTVAWSVFRDDADRDVAPSVTYFRNRLGGRVGVMARSVDCPQHESVYTPRKQELLHNLFAKLADGRLAVHAPKTPGTFVLAAEKDGELLVMVNNLAGEPRSDIALEFADEWKSARMERLGADGKWTPLGNAAVQTVLPFTCEAMVPEFIRLAKHAPDKVPVK